MDAAGDATLQTACAVLLRRIPVWAKARWWQENAPCDLAEYVDAAHEALAGCLGRWDEAKGPFLPYARRRILGALAYAVIGYRNWRHGEHAGGRRDLPAAQAALLRPVLPLDPSTLVEWQEQLTLIPAHLQPIAAGLLAGYSLAAIAQQRGQTPGAVRMACLTWRRGETGVD